MERLGYEFLAPSLAADHECVVCRRVATNPQLTECCKATYCHSCARRQQNRGCSNCRAPSLAVFSDGTQRDKVNGLKIGCLRCSWNGALGDYEAHRSLRHPDTAVGGERPPDFPASSRDSGDGDRTAHAEWTFSDLQNPAGIKEDSVEPEEERHGDERESLIELQQLGAGGREASPVQDESTDYDASAKTSFSIGSQYTSKTSKR